MDTYDRIEFVTRALRSDELFTQETRFAAAALIEELGRRPPVESHQIHVDLTHNIAEREYMKVRLTPNQAVALHVLVEQYPKIVGLEDLMDAVYGKARRPGPNTMRVMVTAVRDRIRVLKAEIHNRHGFGYRLELAPMV